MRMVRLLGVVLSTLTAGLLLAAPAGAQPPSKLADHITDSSGVLTDSTRAEVSTAIDRLYRDKHVRLWVVYVDNFSRFKPENWIEQTRSKNAMGDSDVLLAVATNTKLSAFSVPPKVLSAAASNTLQGSQIDPKVAARDFSGAAVAAADGLDTSASSPQAAQKRTWLLIAVAVGVVVLVLIVVLLIVRRRRRRRAAQQGSLGGAGTSVGQALSTADARLRQITDYVAKYRQNIGSEAQNRLEDAKRHLAAAHAKESSSESEAIAYANGASRLAALAQTLANADVLAAHRTPRRRGS
jgi:uncharacterized membrane protein YgcG